ncbi:hypothetical protein BsWGS_01119 [Bradybaena similaris]
MFKIILPYRSLVVVMMTVLSISWFIQGTTAAAVGSYNSQLEDEITQAVNGLVSRIVQLNESVIHIKNNGGTTDVIYNMPDLENVGR